MIYITSDTHFNHRKANEIIGRPFSCVEEMDKELIKRWNEKTVNDNAIIMYHLGDFSFGYEKDWIKILDKLNFKQMILVAGNHDDYKTLKKIQERYGKRIQIIFNGGLHTIKYNNVKITLSHYPMLSWDKVHYNYKGPNKLISVNLFGHHHGKIMEFMNPKTPWLKYQFDVSVDGNNFYPYLLDDVINKIKENCNHVEYCN